MTFNKKEGLKPRKPFRGDKYDLILAPNETKVVPFKVDRHGYNMGFSESLKFLWKIIKFIYYFLFYFICLSNDFVIINI